MLVQNHISSHGTLPVHLARPCTSFGKAAELLRFGIALKEEEEDRLPVMET